VLDLGIGQRVESDDDLRPRADAIVRRDAVFQGFLEHECKEAAEHVTADGLVELVEDRATCEQVLGGAEGLLHGPQLLVAEHGFERMRSVLVRSTKMPSNFLSSATLSRSTAKCSLLIVLR
jgi:hypothetical protein